MKDEDIAKRIPNDDEKDMLTKFKYAYDHKKDLINEMSDDFNITAGKQWEDEDVEKLRGVGVKALTINKIQPYIFLLSGMQRQNRTDFRAFPEGEEDSIKAEISTRLLKNAVKRCNGDYKLSEVFEDGIICGEGDLQFTVDYTYDLINGDLRFKKISPFQVFVDPDSTEYDLSDAEYIFKLSTDLTFDQIAKLYPDKEKVIKSLDETKINIDNLPEQNPSQDGSYHDSPKHLSSEGFQWIDEKRYDLLEMEYRKYITKHIVIDIGIGSYKMVDSKEEAERYVNDVNSLSPEQPVAKVIKRSIPEIWVRCMVGTKVIEDYRSPLYPRWKGFSIIPFFAHRYTTPIESKEYMVQGIVRSMKDSQHEINKRRTQELRHLNSTANSGWVGEEGVFLDKEKWAKYGSSPGILLEHKKGMAAPQRIAPAPLSQGHEYLVNQSEQDLKTISGINADLLAMEDKTASGRAIYLRQQQGVVMVQRVLDNFQHTKRLMGKLIVSQLGELYSVETAARVLGDVFIRKNFSVPIHEIAGNVMQKRQQDKQYRPSQKEAQIVLQVEEWTKQGRPVPVMDERGQMVMEIDNDAAGAVINQVLSDEELTKYDVSVGEAQSTETIRMANYSMLMELIEKGIPIPPDILIDESMLSPESKNQIKATIEAQRQAAAKLPQK